jgi:hypothetical protein
MFNAVIKGAMAVASVTMYETNRTITQVVTISVSLVLHILVRPYKSATENVVVVLFCIVELLGINASTSAFWQILFIVASFLMLIVVSVMAFKATRASIKEKKMNGLLNDENQYTPLEKKLLLPVFLCVWPLKKMAVLLCRLNKDVEEEGERKAPHGTKVLPREKSDEEDSLPRVCTPRLHELRQQMELVNQGRGVNWYDSNEKNQNGESDSWSEDSSDDDRVGRYF